MYSFNVDITEAEHAHLVGYFTAVLKAEANADEPRVGAVTQALRALEILDRVVPTEEFDARLMEAAQ